MKYNLSRQSLIIGRHLRLANVTEWICFSGFRCRTFGHMLQLALVTTSPRLPYACSVITVLFRLLLTIRCT